MLEYNYHAPLNDQTRRMAHHHIRAGYAARIDRAQAIRARAFRPSGLVNRRRWSGALAFAGSVASVFLLLRVI